jgi:hypothetical protein
LPPKPIFPNRHRANLANGGAYNDYLAWDKIKVGQAGQYGEETINPPLAA